VFSPATSELTDREIDERLSGLFIESRRAFLSDPTYVVEIAEASGRMRERREYRKAHKVAETDT
jgi:hypothetical protein